MEYEKETVEKTKSVLFSGLLEEEGSPHKNE